MNISQNRYYAGLIVILALMLPDYIHSQVAVGVRPLGMGGAYTAVSNDASAIFWNPAGISLIKRGEISVMQADLYGIGLGNQSFSFIHPITGSTALGLGAILLGVEDEGLNFNQNYFQLSLGQRLFNNLWAGTSVKYIDHNASWESLYSETGQGISVDGGALFKMPDNAFGFLKNIWLGVSVKNIGDANFTFDDTGVEEPIYPQNLMFGLSWQPAWIYKNDYIILSPLLSIESDRHPDENRLNIGGEFRISNPADQRFEFTLRGGLQKETEKELAEQPFYSIGAGFRLNTKKFPIQFDYSHTFSNSLPGTNRFAVSIAFLPFLGLFDKVKGNVKTSQNSIYPTLVNFYCNRKDGLSSIWLINERDRAVTGDLKIKIENNLFRPSVNTYTIAPKETLEVSINPTLNRDNLPNFKIAAGVNVPFNFTFVYEYQPGLLDSLELKGSYKMYGSNTIIWDDFRKAAAFITTEDSAVISLSESLTYQDTSWNGSKNFGLAITAFEALRIKGILYEKDSNKHWITDGKPYQKDHIQFPFELLIRKKGDCDDITVLYCSLLEYLGIETALVDAPEHIFMLFNTDIPQYNSTFLAYGDSLFIPFRGTWWVPVEITSLSDGFQAAWRNGSKQMFLDSTLAIETVSRAWKSYPPVLFNSKIENQALSNEQLTQLSDFVDENSRMLEKTRQRYFASEFNHSVNEQANWKLLNKLGILYSGYGLDSLNKAKMIFNRALDLAPDQERYMIYNNIGNLHLMNQSILQARDNYYLSLANSDTALGTYYNLAQLYLLYQNIAGIKTELYNQHIAYLKENYQKNSRLKAYINQQTESANQNIVRGEKPDFIKRLIQAIFPGKRSEIYHWFPLNNSKLAAGKGFFIGLDLSNDDIDPLAGGDLSLSARVAGETINLPVGAVNKFNIGFSLVRNNEVNCQEFNFINYDCRAENLENSRYDYFISLNNRNKNQLNSLYEIEVRYDLPEGLQIEFSKPQYHFIESQDVGRQNVIWEAGADKGNPLQRALDLYWYK